MAPCLQVEEPQMDVDAQTLQSRQQPCVCGDERIRGKTMKVFIHGLGILPDRPTDRSAMERPSSRGPHTPHLPASSARHKLN